VRRYLALSAATLSFVMLTGSSCDRESNCPDDSEAMSMSAELKPTCKPEGKAPKWVEPSPTVKP
jgi:hypothetical protein